MSVSSPVSEEADMSVFNTSEFMKVKCFFLILSLQKLAAECQSAGYSGTLIPYKCDLCNEEEILSMFSAIKTLHQGVDVCINNAGLAHNEPLLSGRTEGWRNMIDVSLKTRTSLILMSSVCEAPKVTDLKTCSIRIC